MLHSRLNLDLPEVRFHYGVRLCPEPAHWGGLSGCTFKEGVSWGKFVSFEDGGRYAEVLCDATIAWPLLLKGVIQRLAKPMFKKPGVIHQDGPEPRIAIPATSTMKSSTAHSASFVVSTPEILFIIFV